MSRIEINNIAELLPLAAAIYPDRPAVIRPLKRGARGRVSQEHLTFAQLEILSSNYAAAFRARGLKKGVRTLVMIKPGLDFIAIVFAVFKTGAVPVLIDPGMGGKNLLKCVADTAPEALIAISPVCWLSKVFRAPFKNVKTVFSLGPLPPPGAVRLEDVSGGAPSEKVPFEPEKTEKSDTAAILFTTGSTGPPKGVVYTHGIFAAQVEIIRKEYGAGPQHTDMAVFPLFALFSAGLGMPCVIPDMDPTKPAQADPVKILESLRNNNVSFSFGSPALWRVVAEYCLKNNIRLTTLKKVLMAGAPVSESLHRMVKSVIAEDGETIVPYGATESLPIANFTGSEMLRETAALTREGKGFCVGYPIPGITIKVMRCSEEPIENWDESMVLPPMEIGETVVSGPVVTPEYHKNPKATAMAKMLGPNGELWHRMGDMGYFDLKGRLWFCGRKNHRVILPGGKLLCSVCCEAIFNQHPDLFRTALVKAGGAPVIIAEPLPGKFPASKSAEDKFISELQKLGAANELTKDISKFMFHPAFPVDIRHNAKIFREKLAVWAEK